MVTATALPMRVSDAHGQGHFKAPRGSRLHKGIDYACYPGTCIASPVEGVVTKLGYPYSQDRTNFSDEHERRKFAAKKAMRYVEVKGEDGFYHRLFYVMPQVNVGDAVTSQTMVGISQDLRVPYGEGMTPHVHYEIVKYDNGKKLYFDPDTKKSF